MPAQWKCFYEIIGPVLLFVALQTPPSRAKSTLKTFVQVLSKVLFFVAGTSFLFGGRAIHEFGNVERVLAEVLGIAIAVALGFGGFIARNAVEDLEWEEANEAALKKQSESTAGQK